MNINYQVGQVLFVIDNSRFGITPIQIVEHHVKTSLEGTENSYFVSVGRTSKVAELSSLGGPIFEESSLAGDYLMSRASEKIEKLVSDANRVAETQFDSMPKNENKEKADQITSSKNKSDSVYVELPDGTKAKLSGDTLENFNS